VQEDQVKEDQHNCSSDGEEKKDSLSNIQLEEKEESLVNALESEQNSAMERLKMVTGELADVWLHEGNRAL
jgi:hypothetical protein